jgi:hypothetical protein
MARTLQKLFKLREFEKHTFEWSMSNKLEYKSRNF